MIRSEYSRHVLTISTHLNVEQRCQITKRVLMLLFGMSMMVIFFCQRNSMHLTYKHLVPHDRYTQNTGCNPVARVNKTNVKDPQKEELLRSFKQNWTLVDERYLHSAFFAGYVMAQLPVGYLCDVFGPKPFLITGMGVSSAATAALPLVFKHSEFISLIVVNGFLGWGQAVLYPGLTCLLVQWFPYQERSMSGAVIFSMYGFGSVFCNLITNIFMSHVHNWIYIFYMWVVIGAMWSILFSAFASSGPLEHDSISLREREFLQENLDLKVYHIQTPVTSILMDINFWAVIISNTASEMLVALLTITVPEYLHLVLHLTPFQEMLVASCPHCLLTAIGVATGFVADYAIVRKRCKPVCVRIIMCLGGILLPALVLMLAFYALCDITYFVVLYTISVAFIGVFYNATILDITVNHAGFVMGLANGIGIFFSMFFCYTVKNIPRSYTLEEWRRFLRLVCGICACSVLFFAIFARGYRAKWDYAPGEVQRLPKEFTWSCFFRKKRDANEN